MSEIKQPSRRELLIRLGKAAAVLGGSVILAKTAFDQGGWKKPGADGVRQVRDFRVPDHLGPSDFAVVHSVPGVSTPASLAQQAVDAIGGMARFISRGDHVVIKPNIGWDRTPLQAANTNPDLVAAVVQMALAAGARDVVVTDASCNDPRRCFTRSGIWSRAANAGANVLFPAEHKFRMMRMQGEVLDEWPVYRTLIEADKVINMPVAKHHNLAKFTGAMKNWYGVLGGRRNRLHQSIDMSVADLATFMRPTLTVMDGLRVLLRNGPQGGNVDDTREMNTVIASTDQVAVDAFACTLIGQKPENLAYLAMAKSRNIGTSEWQTLRPREIAIADDGRIERYGLWVPPSHESRVAASTIVHHWRAGIRG